jgi:hypothetical protein
MGSACGTHLRISAYKIESHIVKEDVRKTDIVGYRKNPPVS